MALSALSGTAAAQERATVEACFLVIEGQADVAPNAPMLIDRCTGSTFVLTRTRRDGKTAFEWVPISKATASTADQSRQQQSPGPPSAKTPIRDGCFTFSGRSYCP